MRIHDPIISLENDLLQRRELARHLLGKIKDPSCPLAIGIYGGWGTGKTSLLNLVQLINDGNQTAEPSCTLEFISVDAWKYDSTCNLFIPIITELMRDIPEAEYKQVDVDIKQLLVATGFTLAGVLISKAFGIKLDDLQASTNLSKEVIKDRPLTETLTSWRELVDDVDRAQTAFSFVVQTALKRYGKDRLVFCIDNLDRCTPEVVVRFLESIKNFLSVPDCVWLFAMDSSVVVNFVKNKYGNVDGYSYLDKIIPEQFHIPLSSSPEDFQKVQKLLNRVLGSMPMQDVIDWEHYGQLPRVMAPRRLIKSASKYRELCVHGFTSPPDLLFPLIVLYHCWPDFYERLSSCNENHLHEIFCLFSNQLDIKTSFVAEFAADQELCQFVIISILPMIDKYQEKVILSAMRELRRVGLP